MPFNSTNKFQLSVHETSTGKENGLLLVMKGAPERILERSKTILINGETVELNNQWKNSFHEAYGYFYFSIDY